MKCIIFALLVVTISASISTDFAQFEAKYGRNYLPSERAYRAKVFQYNMEWANKVNSENHSFRVGMTPFADMTNTEFRSSQFCGCSGAPPEFKPTAPITDAPLDAIDWREKGAVTRVKHQGQCGSCWVFGAIAAIESGNFIHNGKLIELSEQQVVDCDTKGQGCNGGFHDFAFNYVHLNGVCTEEAYPYHAKDEDCKADKCTPAVQITGIGHCDHLSATSLKAAVSKTPVAVMIDASSSVFQMYTGGVIDDYACSTLLNHIVMAAGYTEDYWIVKNSWGTDWGEQGYVRIKYVAEGAGICGINSFNSYPLFD